MHLLGVLILFIATSILLILGIIGTQVVKRRVNFSRSFTLIILAYGMLASELFIILYTLLHIHSIRVLHLHLSNLINHQFSDPYNLIQIGRLIHIVLGITVIIFISAILFSQISLRILTRKIIKTKNEEQSAIMRQKLPWLSPRYKFNVINNDTYDAFTFTLLRFKNKRFIAEDWIVITSSLIEILTEDELEMVIAHEYSHTYEYDTRYTHLIYTIASMLFFDPVLKFFKHIIHEKHEINADAHAVEMLGKPKTLAKALFKLLNELKRISQNSYVSTGFFSPKKHLIIRRIKLLIEYADTHNIDK